MSSARAVASTAVIALAVLALVACGTPPRPVPPTAEEVEAIRLQHLEYLWDSMDIGAPMPDVETIAVLPAQEAIERQGECLEAADLSGVQVSDAGWSISGEHGDPDYIAAQAQWWVCSQQFRLEGDTDFILSESELEWLYGFYVERYRPCVATMGHELLNFPRRDVFLGTSAGYALWVPHDFSLNPVPTPEEWDLLALRCPLPQMLAGYELPGYRLD